MSGPTQLTEGMIKSPPRPDMFDDRRPRYEILRVVNRGGMGEIALARAKGVKGFEKLVVLKRLRADAEREDHIQMFDVEQEVMSRIEHPNIVQVFDQPYIDDVPYMAMEYIRGRNLDQIIRAALQVGRELPLNLSLTITVEVLRGLSFVHRLKDSDGRPLGVVHQDMTPSNVMVSFFGEVKVTDFGISYVTSRDGGLRQGVLKGKPRYVAPEVLAGKRVNNRADIYGVGVVLFELLTGKALFARTSIKETLAAVARNELPDIEEELQKYGAGVANILARSLRKDPAERYQSTDEMAAEVLDELSKRGGPVPPATVGYLVRELFKDDPDVPELDPAMEQAINRVPTTSERAAGLSPRNLDETLKELDRLLGPSNSVDLFTLPPELALELDELPDMEPFNPEVSATDPYPGPFDRSGTHRDDQVSVTTPEGMPRAMMDDARLSPKDASTGAVPMEAMFEERSTHAMVEASQQPLDDSASPALDGSASPAVHDSMLLEVRMAYGRGMLLGFILGAGVSFGLRLLGI